MKNMTMKAALFDLDGVVFNTEPQYSVFWGAQCREFHPEIPGLENIIKGQTLVQIYDAWFSGPLQDQQAVITARLDEFERHMSYDYVAGFEDYVRGLRRQGVKTAVVTSSNQPKMEAVYAKRPEFKELFDAILTAEDFERSKPDPDCYLKAAQCFGIDANDCAVSVLYYFRCRKRITDLRFQLLRGACGRNVRRRTGNDERSRGN